MGRTVRKTIQDTSDKPFALLTEELGVNILCIGAARLELLALKGKDVLPAGVTQ